MYVSWHGCLCVVGVNSLGAMGYYGPQYYVGLPNSRAGCIVSLVATESIVFCKWQWSEGLSELYIGGELRNKSCLADGYEVWRTFAYWLASMRAGGL